MQHMTKVCYGSIADSHGSDRMILILIPQRGKEEAWRRGGDIDQQIKPLVPLNALKKPRGDVGPRGQDSLMPALSLARMRPPSV